MFWIQEKDGQHFLNAVVCDKENVEPHLLMQRFWIQDKDEQQFVNAMFLDTRKG